MKIIANMNSNTYLAEISSRELRELNSDISVQIGSEYDISKAADTLAALRSLNTSKLKYISNQIKDLEKNSMKYKIRMMH